MSYSKYHTADSVPFPGNDAVTLAVGMPETKTKEVARECFVFDNPACIDCAHCRDGDHPHNPERWECVRDPCAMTRRLCYIVRNVPSLCGQNGQWFRDALAD